MTCTKNIILENLFSLIQDFDKKTDINIIVLLVRQKSALPRMGWPVKNIGVSFPVHMQLLKKQTAMSVRRILAKRRTCTHGNHLTN